MSALEDEVDLPVVVVAVAGGSEAAGGCNALAGGLVGQIATDLLGQFVEAGEEDGLFVLLEALHVSGRTFGQEKTTATGDLEALVNELVLIRVGEEAEVDARSPDGLAILLLVELAFAEQRFESFRAKGAGP